MAPAAACGRAGIRTGYNADFLVLGADPRLDVANLKRIERVMLAGSFIDRESLLTATARR